MKEVFSAESETQSLSLLLEKLKRCSSDQERIAILNEQPKVEQWLKKSSQLRVLLSALGVENELILKSLIAINQADHLLPEFSLENLQAMCRDLLPVEAFYKEIGGIVGYHWTMLSCLQSQFGSSHETRREDSYSTFYHRPPGTDISSPNEGVRTLMLEGIVSLPFLAEMYPVGGAADRLKFCDSVTGEALPAAKLPFCGYFLLERLIRDVAAREYLYYKLFGAQVTTPIAMMTSFEKDNYRYIHELCQSNQWFGRPPESFRIFCQPSVPTMDKNGKWCLKEKMKLLMKPGGHGVIWKLAEKNGIFDWMKSLGTHKLLVRQINNPIAGIDYGLLAFSGAGFQGNKSFGFASCPRQVGSAEGIDVLIEKTEKNSSRYCLTNIEYCDFTKYSLEDVPFEPGSSYSQFPSNTNILFADISAVETALERCPIPGMLVNLKKMSFVTDVGKTEEREVARLESTMQNLADCFETIQTPDQATLDTYLTYNHRQKTISAIKKLYPDNNNLLETPEGCLYDFLCCAYDLLTNDCSFDVPEVPTTDLYIEQGPSFLFSYHPALGPLYSIIGQKMRKGRFGFGSELKLEIAEADIENLTLAGSLLITAQAVMGHFSQQGFLNYSEKIGSILLRNVVVENLGIDRTAENIYWKDEIKRNEKCEILIQGDGEFVAENITLRGNLRIEVDSGYRVTAFEENGLLKFKKEPLASVKKQWIYHLADDGSIFLS